MYIYSFIYIYLFIIYYILYNILYICIYIYIYNNNNKTLKGPSRCNLKANNATQSSTAFFDSSRALPQVTTILYYYSGKQNLENHLCEVTTLKCAHPPGT